MIFTLEIVNELANLEAKDFGKNPYVSKTISDIRIGDCISFHEFDNKVLVGKIVKNNNNKYQLSYINSDKLDFVEFTTLNKLIEYYSEYEWFSLLKVGEYNGLVPKETSSYGIVMSNNSEMLLCWLISEDDSLSIINELTDEVICSANTYDELMIKLFKMCSVVLPFRD